MEYRFSNEEIIHELKKESYLVMCILAEAMGYEEWVDAEGGIWPPDAMWGEHMPETAAMVVRDEMLKLRALLAEATPPEPQ